MGIGYSGYSDPKTANMGANTAPPEAPENFQVKEMPTMNDGGNNNVKFTFKRPTKTILTLVEAVSDDVFDLTIIGTTSDAVHNANVTVINTAANYTTSLTVGDIIQFGTDTHKYIIKAITASQITLTYGLNSIVMNLTDIKKATKTAESPATSRQFRINSKQGNTVEIYHQVSGQTLINKWTATTTLGSFLDIDKILANISEENRTFAKDIIMSADASPIELKVGTEAQAGQKAIIFNGLVTAKIIADDYLCFGDDETFYQVASVPETNAILLKTNLAKTLTVNTKVYKKKLMTDGETPVPYTFTSYNSALLTEFTSQENLDDLSGYNVYVKTSTQTQNSKGTKLTNFPTNDANLTNNSDGTSEYSLSLPDDTYNGKSLYFGLSAYDAEMPAYNESDADINAHVITLPSIVNVSNVVLDAGARTATITYSAVTTGGKNPHLLDMMGNNIAQYSINGGFDLYKCEFAALDMGQGYYLGIDANNAKIIHPDILAGDFIEVRDSSSRNIWVNQATVNGSVDLNESVKTYGAVYSYLTGHSSLNITAKRATVNKSTDSVLPLTTGESPVKQYLTEYQNTHVVENLEANKEYLFVMESVDTQIVYEKL